MSSQTVEDYYCAYAEGKIFFCELKRALAQMGKKIDFTHLEQAQNKWWESCQQWAVKR